MFKERLDLDSQKYKDTSLNNHSQNSQKEYYSSGNDCKPLYSHENSGKVLTKYGQNQNAKNIIDQSTEEKIPWNKSYTPNNQSMVKSSQSEVKSFKFNKRLPPIINNDSKVSLKQLFPELAKSSQTTNYQFSRNQQIKLFPKIEVEEINEQTQCHDENSNNEGKLTYFKNVKGSCHSDVAIERLEVYSSLLRNGLASEISNQSTSSNKQNTNSSRKDSSSSLKISGNLNENKLGFLDRRSTMSLDQESTSALSYHFCYGKNKNTEDKNNSNNEVNHGEINYNGSNSLISNFDTYQGINSLKELNDSRNINSILSEKEMKRKLEVLRKLNDLQKSRSRTPKVSDVRTVAPLIKIRLHKDSLFKKQR